MPAMLSRFLPFFRWSAVFALFLTSAAQAAPFEDSMAQRLLACTGCHGAQGRAGADGFYPRLAGKPEGYLFNQLLNIRDGRRHYAPMRALLEPLTDTYLLDIARYFSRLELPYPAPAAPALAAAQLRRGQQLATEGDAALELPACTQCHGKTLTGALPHIPGLLGLPRDYLNAQLGGWRTHQRQAHAPDCMAQVAGRLQAQDVAAVTHWLASQPVPPLGKPQAAVSPWPPGSKVLRCGSASPVVAATSGEAANAQVREGAYLARIGNCASCHTAPQGAPYAGQRAIETPFGAVYSSNITPDVASGIGAWSADDFWQAMHHGRSRDGRLLSPAFPYTSFKRMTREDTDALLAFLKTVTPVVQPNRTHSLRWPVGTQPALAVWRALYFSPQEFAPDGRQSALWNRGAYLVNGPGHCGECHTPRNALGASTDLALSGAVLPVTNWVAPSLRDGAAAGVSASQREATALLLKTGVSRHAQANGPMAEVVQGGTQYLRDADLQAMLEYLGSLATPTGVTSPRDLAAQAPVPASRPASTAAALYQQHCADCHGRRGEGVSGAYPALAGSRAVQAVQANNLIYSVLRGGFAPVTVANPRPYGMPPFLLTLTDAQVAQVLTYVRQAWGNQAAAVAAQQVTLARNRVGR